MQIPEGTRFVGDEDPLYIWWIISGALKNFSSGYTFELKFASAADPSTIIFTKTDGFTGAAGSGTREDPDGIPNLVVQWASTGELNDTDIVAGKYTLEIVATAGDGSETTYQMLLTMKQRLGT